MNIIDSGDLRRQLWDLRLLVPKEDGFYGSCVIDLDDKRIRDRRIIGIHAGNVAYCPKMLRQIESDLGKLVLNPRDYNFSLSGEDNEINTRLPRLVSLISQELTELREKCKLGVDQDIRFLLGIKGQDFIPYYLKGNEKTLLFTPFRYVKNHA